MSERNTGFRNLTTMGIVLGSMASLGVCGAATLSTSEFLNNVTDCGESVFGDSTKVKQSDHGSQIVIDTIEENSWMQRSCNSNIDKTTGDEKKTIAINIGDVKVEQITGGNNEMIMIKTPKVIITSSKTVPLYVSVRP